MGDRKKALQQRISSAIRWMEKQRDQNLDMVTDAGDASIWCKDEADLIMDHINAIRALIADPAAIRREARAGALSDLLTKWVQRDESLDAAFDAAENEHSEGDSGNANDIVEAALRALIDQEPSDG